MTKRKRPNTRREILDIIIKNYSEAWSEFTALDIATKIELTVNTISNYLELFRYMEILDLASFGRSPKRDKYRFCWNQDKNKHIEGFIKEKYFTEDRVIKEIEAYTEEDLEPPLLLYDDEEEEEDELELDDKVVEYLENKIHPKKKKKKKVKKVKKIEDECEVEEETLLFLETQKAKEVKESFEKEFWKAPTVKDDLDALFS